MPRLILITLPFGATRRQQGNVATQAFNVLRFGGVLVLPHGSTWEVIDADDINVRVDGTLSEATAEGLKPM